ncbi:hypothetical protein DL769_007909 [Monosporascus sp. CRB-8-3]|nr:hypothetical protein DL769_007909 [Monosporascus sp. CRB-8-3]
MTGSISVNRYGGAEVAEFLEAIGNIRGNDPISWYRAWSDQAQKAEKIAQDGQDHVHRSAARMAFLRASNYTRASAYMMTGDEPRKSDAHTAPILKKAVELFRKAMPLMDGPVHILQIPYQDEIRLPAYLYLPPPSCRVPGKTPLVVNPVGADSMQEEIYHMFPVAGPELGYAVLTFEGPGQGLTLHEHNVPMRPDWEAVAGVVMDYLSRYAADHPGLELDLDRVAIAGASMGGYFALRGAADSRFKACVAVDPIYDLWDFVTRHVSAILSYWDEGWVPDAVINNVVWLAMRFSFQTRWEITTSARFLGVSTPTEILRAMKQFTLQQTKGSYLDQLECATFVMGAANSLYLDVDNHAVKVFNRLKHEQKEIWVAESPSQGSLQATMGAMGICNQRVFEFLDRRFGVDRLKAS